MTLGISAAEVAVIIPAKDAAATIGRAVTSALAQKCATEVLVIDDVRQANKGPSAAINRAQGNTRAPYWCILDADDFFLPNRFEGIFTAAGLDWDLAADGLLLTTAGREDGPYDLWRGHLPADGLLTFESFVRGCITDPRRPRTELGYLQPLFRRDFLDQHGLFHDETLRLGEDYVMYAEALAAGGRFRVVETPGYVIVNQPNSLSNRHWTADLAALLEAEKRIAARPELRPIDRRALAAHMRDTRRKLLFRRALDQKAAGNFAGAVATLLPNPQALAYAIRQTAKSRFAPPKPS